jgi:hypothetical protein
VTDRSVCGDHWLPEPCAECEREGKAERAAIQCGEKPCPICGAEAEHLLGLLRRALPLVVAFHDMVKPMSAYRD